MHYMDSIKIIVIIYHRDVQAFSLEDKNEGVQRILHQQRN